MSQVSALYVRDMSQVLVLYMGRVGGWVGRTEQQSATHFKHRPTGAVIVLRAHMQYTTHPAVRGCRAPVTCTADGYCTAGPHAIHHPPCCGRCVQHTHCAVSPARPRTPPVPNPRNLDGYDARAQLKTGQQATLCKYIFCVAGCQGRAIFVGGRCLCTMTHT